MSMIDNIKIFSSSVIVSFRNVTISAENSSMSKAPCVGQITNIYTKTKESVLRRAIYHDNSLVNFRYCFPSSIFFQFSYSKKEKAQQNQFKSFLRSI